MLQSIKSYIDSLPDISFSEYYQKYIFSVQDRNIGIETDFNGPTFISINKIISAIHRELGNIK